MTWQTWLVLGVVAAAVAAAAGVQPRDTQQMGGTRVSSMLRTALVAVALTCLYLGLSSEWGPLMMR